MDIILIFKYVGVAIALIVVCSPLIILAYVIERLFIQLRMTPIKEENFRLRRKISVICIPIAISSFVTYIPIFIALMMTYIIPLLKGLFNG